MHPMVRDSKIPQPPHKYRNCIFLEPHGGWNDHGYYTTFEIHYGGQKIGYTKIGFLDQTENECTVDHLLGYFPALGFGSMISQTRFYRDIGIRDELKNHIRHALNDIELPHNLNLKQSVNRHEVVEKSLDRDGCWLWGFSEEEWV